MKEIEERKAELMFQEPCPEPVVSSENCAVEDSSSSVRRSCLESSGKDATAQDKEQI